MNDVMLIILITMFFLVIISIIYWILDISYNHPFEWLFGDMPYWYYIENKDYIGLNKTIGNAISLDFKPNIIKYNDIDDVCRAVKNSASEVYPTLLNEQIIENIKFLYRNEIYLELWNTRHSNHIHVPYKSIQKYVEKPDMICGDVVLEEKEFLEICERLKKEKPYVK